MSEKLFNFKYTNNGLFPIRYMVTKKKAAAGVNNLNRGYRTTGVSEATRRKITAAARVLSYCAKKVQVRNSKGIYFTHHTQFITLTLPAAQIHEDREITKIVLGTFLDRCRKVGLLSNYVWRAEKQANGNIHYHILTDTFCNFSILRNYWYIACRQLGYMQAYKEKFSAMSLYDYSNQAFNKGKNLSEIAAAYGRGQRCQWSQPPACHTEHCTSAAEVSRYISKYVSKKDKEAENIVTGRVWGCSQSVSAAVNEFKTDPVFNQFWYEFAAFVLKKKEYTADFFSVILCSFQSLCAWSRGTFKDIISKLWVHFEPCQFYRKSLGMT